MDSDAVKTLKPNVWLNLKVNVHNFIKNKKKLLNV